MSLSEVRTSGRSPRRSCSQQVFVLDSLSGAATTASRLGQPDLAIATLNDFVEAGQMVSSLDATMPVIADADTGYA